MTPGAEVFPIPSTEGTLEATGAAPGADGITRSPLSSDWEQFMSPERILLVAEGAEYCIPSFPQHLSLVPRTGTAGGSAGGLFLFFLPAKSSCLQLALGPGEKYWLYKKEGCQVIKSFRKRKPSEMGGKWGQRGRARKAAGGRREDWRHREGEGRR